MRYVRSPGIIYDYSAATAAAEESSASSSFSSVAPSCACVDPEAPVNAAAAAEAALAAADFFFFFLFLLADAEEAEPLPTTGLVGRVHPGAAVRTSTPVGVIRSVSSNWAEYFPSGVAAVHYLKV